MMNKTIQLLFVTSVALFFDACSSEDPIEIKCKGEENSAIDFALYQYPKDYSKAAHAGSIAKSECLAASKNEQKIEQISTNSAEKGSDNFSDIKNIDNERPNKTIISEGNEKNERVTTVDPVIVNDIFYLQNENKPFTGRYETYYVNGNKKGISHIKDGKFDGLMTLYDENGKITYEKTIKDGKELPVNTTSTDTKKNHLFNPFLSEAELVKKELQCPNTIDTDITPALFEGSGRLYGCILGKMETVKWFINETPNTNQIESVKFLWNDWFNDVGFGVHSDKKEAQKALNVLIKLYAPEKSKEINIAFSGVVPKKIVSKKFILDYSYDRGSAIDERMIVVKEK